MELKDGVDDRTFRVNFSTQGVGKLRAMVTDKLKEFMGEYTDDTLVEYVIVLLRNGRRRDEAKNELDVFLGDDSDSFVTWLWDHLASHIDQYVLPTEEVSKARPASVENAVKNASRQIDADSDRRKHEREPKSRYIRDWEGVERNVAQPPTKEGKPHIEARHRKHSVSPEPDGRSKRNRPEEPTWSKEVVSKGNVNAPLRLLQFAVRDAVATSRPPHSLSEPAVKRLRSVVSSSIVDSTSEAHSQRLCSLGRVPSAVATAIRSVAEAAEDVVKKYKPTGNVFDRLSRGVDVQESSKQVRTLRSGVDDEEYDDFDQFHEVTPESYRQEDLYGGKHVGMTTAMETDSVLASDSASDNEGYDAVNVISHGRENVSHISTSGGKKKDDSLMLQYSVAQDTDVLMRPPRTRDPDPSVGMAGTSRKIVNISVNVNTWKPSHYQPSVEVKGPKARESLQPSNIAVEKSSLRLIKENSNPITVAEKGKAPTDVQNEVQKTFSPGPGSYSTGRPLEDADSRTIFVNNVHFAATKDSLSRHFNKFGEVLKVIILVDPATGLPKGSAYIEFIRKEAAENALSLDGTSFMSRILKVVSKGSAHLEASPIISWPRVARASPFAASRFTRAPFPRALPGAYRARAVIKSGARSLQWKRDSLPTSAVGAPSAYSISGISPSPSPRGLTYVRPELKANAKPTAA